uniref:Mediator of RNA polymerase II transcription subunit 11 n=1 Tax=Scapholeberis mucronata TaxID=202097 RepID=A0A4Y7NN69_9CRUS|nr:EOG090X0LXA [Scapholeberis mucronata]SVE94034.1 EOG090X0LXA [Scapholeberis mucronata]
MTTNVISNRQSKRTTKKQKQHASVCTTSSRQGSWPPAASLEKAVISSTCYYGNFPGQFPKTPTDNSPDTDTFRSVVNISFKMANAMPIERLQALDNVEKEIASCIQSAGQALLELSKDKASMKQVESHTSQFLKTLNHVEAELSRHINYLTQVSTGQPHEGSAYGSSKMYKTARHRLEHTRTRLQDLENLKNRALATTTRPVSAQNHTQ